MKRTVLVPIADGSEELEAVTIIDVLRRAGAELTVASVGKLEVTASRGTRLVADRELLECTYEQYDLIVLPGGMPGAEHLRDCRELEVMLRRQMNEQRLYAAICAAPVVVLQHHGLMGQEGMITCHPSFVGDLRDNSAAEARVVVDGNCITSKGAGTAIEFTLKLIEILYDADKAREIANEILVPDTLY